MNLADQTIAPKIHAANIGDLCAVAVTYKVGFNGRKGAAVVWVCDLDGNMWAKVDTAQVCDIPDLVACIGRAIDALKCGGFQVPALRAAVQSGAIAYDAEKLLRRMQYDRR